MNYPYTAENQLNTPHNYMYARYLGQDFLNSYIADRRYRLALNREAVSSTSVPLDLGGLNYSIASLELQPLPLSAFTVRERIELKPLLASLLGELAAGNVLETQPWLERLIQRFEVSKRLYSVYTPGFKKGEGDFSNVSHYFELGRCLLIGFAMTGKLQYLSTLLKLVDLLLSLPPHTFSSTFSFERLQMIVEGELEAVLALAREKGVRIDSA